MRHKVQINDKSGRSVVVRCESFTINFAPDNSIASVEWDTARPKPLTVGVDEIESVWALR